MVAAWGREYRLGLQFLASGAAVVHLAMIAAFPGGWNGLVSVDAREEVPHLTYFPVSDVFGFPVGQANKGFIRYTMFTQQGLIEERILPDPRVLPNLRYDRWAAAADALSSSPPEQHALLSEYILAHLPATPIKLELYSGAWLEAMAPAAKNGEGEIPARYRLSILGSHDGLTRVWQPKPRRERRRK